MARERDRYNRKGGGRKKPSEKQDKNYGSGQELKYVTPGGAEVTVKGGNNGSRGRSGGGDGPKVLSPDEVNRRNSGLDWNLFPGRSNTEAGQALGRDKQHMSKASGKSSSQDRIAELLDAILSRLDAPAAGGVSAPDRATFMAPYDQAEAATRSVYGEVVPSIQNTYAQLGSGLDQSAGAFDQRMADLSSASRADQANARQDVVAAQTPVAVDPGQLAGSLAAEVAANTNAQAQEQGVRDEASRAFLDEVAAMGAADSQGMKSSAEAQGAGAKSNADAQLQAALTQIGLGRAGAEADWASANAQAQAQNAEIGLRDRELRVQEADQAMQDFEAIQQDIIKQSTVDEFEQGWGEFSERRPMASQDIALMIGGAGKERTALNMSVAMNALKAGLSEGTFAERDAQELAEWIRKYYMGGETVDRQQFLALGGDERFLG